MKKLYFIPAMLLTSLTCIYAQTRKCSDPSLIKKTTPYTNKVNAVAVDFTATFTDGTKFNLYNFLNGGSNRYVKMDMFFTD